MLFCWYNLCPIALLKPQRFVKKKTLKLIPVENLLCISKAKICVKTYYAEYCVVYVAC